MPPQKLSDRLWNWASVLDEKTLEQARVLSRVPIIEGHVALMPDAHLGKGSTVGSVIPTRDAVIPSAVGVDLGCGMVAAETDRRVEELPDSLDPLVTSFEEAIPAGMGRQHTRVADQARAWLRDHPPPNLDDRQLQKALLQFGTLGGGNHFVELAHDERGVVWLVMHSGSRGVGNELASEHIARAKRDMAGALTSLEDPDLAYFVQGTPAFDAYIADMLWSQEYAMANRAAIMDAALGVFARLTGGRERLRINCHHNYTTLEVHDGRTLWITRKGAIRAERGDLGVIPGAMGAKSYVVEGLGNPASYCSCAHGAGRLHSRTAARKLFTVEEFQAAMAGRSWQSTKADVLLDEAPMAYKDIDQVMSDQADLVKVLHVLTGLVSYKGADEPRGWRRGKARSRRGAEPPAAAPA